MALDGYMAACQIYAHHRAVGADGKDAPLPTVKWDSYGNLLSRPRSSAVESRASECLVTGKTVAAY